MGIWGWDVLLLESFAKRGGEEMTIKIKESREKYITLKLIDEDLEIEIKYSKNSRLTSRLELLKKLKELLYKL